MADKLPKLPNLPLEIATEQEELKPTVGQTEEDSKEEGEDTQAPGYVSDHPLRADETRKVIRPLGQAASLPQTYGFSFWKGAGQTLTRTSQINPTASMIHLTAASAIVLVSNPSILAGVAGQVLRLIGTSDSNTITLKDGLGTRLVGPWVAGLNDTLTLYFDGINWVEVARTNWVSSTTSSSSSSSSSISTSSSSSSTTTTP